MDKQRGMFEAWYQKSPFAGVHRGFADYKHFAYAAWQSAIAAQWQPIETLPAEQLLATREMFIVRGFGVEGVSIMPYTTDAYAVWLESDCGCHYKFARWKHNFQPTHWMPLPPEPAK